MCMYSTGIQFYIYTVQLKIIMLILFYFFLATGEESTGVEHMQFNTLSDTVYECGTEWQQKAELQSYLHGNTTP